MNLPLLRIFRGKHCKCLLEEVHRTSLSDCRLLLNVASSFSNYNGYFNYLAIKLVVSRPSISSDLRKRIEEYAWYPNPSWAVNFSAGAFRLERCCLQAETSLILTSAARSLLHRGRVMGVFLPRLRF